jgi:hypothetical protein
LSRRVSMYRQQPAARNRRYSAAEPPAHAPRDGARLGGSDPDLFTMSNNPAAPAEAAAKPSISRPSALFTSVWWR